MRQAVIVGAVRTPIGRRGGVLSHVHPVDLLALTLRALVDRVNLDPARIDDVIAGCVTQVGEQSVNVARNAALAAGFPESVPGTTVDRQCGSSQQAIHFAAQGIMSGCYDIVLACGVESMSRVPLFAAAEGPGKPYGSRLLERYGGSLVHQGNSAEMVVERFGLTRVDLDSYSLASHQRAARAQVEGRFASELVEVPGSNGVPIGLDDGVRHDTSMEKLAKLKPAFREGGSITAGNASQISDGAAAVLLAEEGVAEKLMLPARARIRAMSVVADDPLLMLMATIPATKQALGRAGLDIGSVDLFEVSEAFASPVLAWQKTFGISGERVNVNGGGISLGHPVGASGARMMTTLLHELERRNGRFGLQTMCEGGGMANATIIER
ncbi:thiolase family protein [bacterium]|nr:MAG: thiolase family protein [bacterium]